MKKKLDIVDTGSAITLSNEVYKTISFVQHDMYMKFLGEESEKFCFFFFFNYNAATAEYVGMKELLPVKIITSTFCAY